MCQLYDYSQENSVSQRQFATKVWENMKWKDNIPKVHLKGDFEQSFWRRAEDISNSAFLLKISFHKQKWDQNMREDEIKR